MAMEVEMVVHLNTLETTLGVVLGQLGEHVDLQLGCVPVFLDVANDFYSNNFVLSQILTFHHFSEGPLSQLLYYFVPATGIRMREGRYGTKVPTVPYWYYLQKLK